MSKPFTDSPACDVATVGGKPAELLDAPCRLIVTPHPVLLDGQRSIVAGLLPGESLASFLRRHVPDIDSGAWAVSIGGLEVPPAMWARTWPKHGQLISCRGSVHKSALAFIAVGAVAYFGFGLSLLLSAGLGVGAALVTKALQPKIPATPTAASGREIYSLRGQRNTARAYAPIGTLLGELRVTPDLASQSYTYFEGDDQYLSTILLGGINVASYADLAVGDTPLSSYSDVTVYTNGFSGMASGDMPLFSNADTIAGATLEDTTAWVTRTSSTDTVTLQVDIEYQLYNQRGEGSPSLTVVAEYRAVGGGAWLAWRSETFTNRTTEVRRATWSRSVARGQYEVRMRRTNGVNEENVTRSVQWAALRSVQPDDADYSGWGRIGIRIKASGQLNGSLDTVRATFKPRPLPVWNGSAWINATTRPGVSNPGAIILQVLRGIWDGDVLQFGYGLSDDQIDVEGLKGFILHCTANGYTYDRWITESISLGALLEEIALAGLGQFMWLDGSRPTVMWAADDQPIGGVVNMANIARSSFSVDYQLTEAADGIEYQFVDRDRNYETTTLRVMAPGVTTMLKPARVTGSGVTTEAHAAVLARYHLAQTLYQYKEISFGADLERLDYRRMSMLSLSHDMTQWGYGGRLIGAAVVGSDIVLTLDEPVPSLPSRFVGLRIPGERDYRVFGVQAFTGPSDTITLTTAAADWPAGVAFPGDSAANPAHDTLWCYDVKATPGYRVRVVAIEPDSDLKGATVRVVPEGDQFWDYVLTGTYVPAPSESLIPQLVAPTVLNIRVQAQTNRQGDTEWVQLNVVWDSTGDMGHAQVWAAIDGQPLRLVDGQALGNRSSFRIDENGDWLIQVRPFDSNGKGGTSASVLFVADAINRPPSNVDTFTVDEVDGGLRRYRFGYSGAVPGSYAGVRICYRAGSTPIVAADWDSLTPLGAAGDVYTQTAESTLPAAGTWTFAARSISTAGVLASTVRSVTVTLGSTFSDILEPDATPAPTPTGVSITAGFSKLIIEHDTPSYTQGHGHGQTRVCGVLYAGGAEPVISSASVLGEFTGDIGRVPVELGTTWRIWVKWVTNDGTESVTAAGGSGTNGIAVTVGKVGNSDLGSAIVEAGNLANGAVTAGKVAASAIDLTKFASGIEPVSIVVGAMPTTKITSAIIWTDGKLYRWVGSSYSKATDGADITANSITAGQIAAGAIGADQIAANAITTGKLLVTGKGRALNDDPMFVDPSAWTYGGGTTFTSGTSATGAAGATYVTNSTGASNALVQSRRMPINPNKTYKLKANLYAASGNDRNMYVFVRLYNGAGTELTGADTGWGGSLAGYVFGGTPPTDQWSEQGGQFGAGTARAIPSNAQFVEVGVWFQYSGGGSSSVTQACQNLRFEETVGADLIVDGAIIASKIAANAITVGSAAIENGAIRRALIEDAAIDSAKIADAAIVTAKIGEAQITNAKIANIDATKITTGLLVADRIDTRNLTIKDGSGNVLFGAGTNLAASYITPASGWLNSNITLNADGTISGAGGGGATLAGMGLSTFRVVAMGDAAAGVPATPGLYKDGTNVGGYARSYMLAVIRRSDAAVISVTAFDVYGTAGQDAALAAALNAVSSSYIVVVYTHDEPQNARLTGGLAEAMYRCGASRATFGSPQFKFRSAYALIGIAGCGEGNGAEAYQGSVDGDTNAWIDVGFSLRGGNIVGVNAAYTPRTLADYSYTGDLNATYGAQLGSTLKDSGGTVLEDAAVKNSAISISISAGGALSASGGPSASGSVTLSGLGAGALATISQITSANVSTYIASAAINLANINVASIGTLGALSSYLGTVEIAAGGYLRSGKTSFSDTTAGFYLANSSGNPQFHVGNPSAYLKYSPSTGFELKLDGMTASMDTSTTYTNVSNGGPRDYGYATTTVSGGTGPYSYSWNIYSATMDNGSGTEGIPDVGMVSVSTNQAYFRGGAANAYVRLAVECVVTDSNGRSARAVGNVEVLHGTYMP